MSENCLFEVERDTASAGTCVYCTCPVFARIVGCRIVVISNWLNDGDYPSSNTRICDVLIEYQ